MCKQNIWVFECLINNLIINEVKICMCYVALCWVSGAHGHWNIVFSFILNHSNNMYITTSDQWPKEKKSWKQNRIQWHKQRPTMWAGYRVKWEQIILFELGIVQQSSIEIKWTMKTLKGHTLLDLNDYLIICANTKCEHWNEFMFTVYD